MKQIFDKDKKYYRIVFSKLSQRPQQYLYFSYDPTVREEEYIDIYITSTIEMFDNVIQCVNALVKTMSNIQRQEEIHYLREEINELKAKIIKQGDLIVSLHATEETH